MKAFKTGIFLIALLFSVNAYAMRFEVDNTCADQGATSKPKCMKSIINANGTTNPHELYLPARIVAGTPYTVTTALAIPANYTVTIDKGSYFTGAGAVTGILNPKPSYFGAKGDGTTDDTTAISKMFGASLALSSTFDGDGKSYKLTATISKTLSANVKWKIQNFKFSTATIAEPVSEHGALLITGNESITGGVWSGTNKIELDNVVFTDSRTAPLGTLDGIQILNFDEITLTNIRTTGYSNTGIMIEVSRNVNITNCEASSNLYAGLRYDNIYGLVITGGQYNNNGISAPNYGYGIAGSAGDQVNSNINLLIQGVTANGNFRKGIDFHAGIHAKIIGNHISGFGQNGIYALSDAGGDHTREIIIIGNTIEGDSASFAMPVAGIAIGAYGVNTSNPGNFIVANNIISYTDYAGSEAIEIDTASTGYATKSVMIEGNIIANGAGAGSASIIDVRGGNLLLGSVKIANNILHAVTCQYGIGILNATNATIDGNQLTLDSGTITEAIHAVESPSRVVSINNNLILGAASFTSFISDATQEATWTAYNNSVAATGYTGVLSNVYPNGVRMTFLSAIPSSGYWGKGSTVFNTAAATGAPGGWTCITAGTPGVWKAWANLP